MRRLTALTCAILGIALAQAEGASAQAGLGCGDVDVDGDFDAADVLAYRQWLVGTIALSPEGQAQCTVIAPARPCDVLNYAVMVRNLAPALGPPFANVCADDDLDGLSDSADLCRGSPAGVPGIGQGCTALDLVLRPEPLLEPPSELLAEAVRLLGSPELASAPELQSLLGMAQATALELVNAEQLLRGGDVCSASAAFGSAIAALQAERTALAGELARIRFEIQIATPPAESGHPGDGQLAMLPLDLGVQTLDDALSAAGIPSSLIAAACAAVTGPIATQARVVRADAAQRTVRLENGLVFAIVDTTAVGEFSRGQRVDVTGTGFGSPIGGANSGIADSVTAVDEGSPSDAEAGYLFLRIAPVQGFPPHSTAPLVLHQADAYARPSATLALERGARIAVVGSVANTPQPGPWTRYSAKIWMRTGLSTPHPIAEDMEPGDVPVDLPWSVPNGLAAELVFRVREQSCSGINPPVCGPFQKVREEVRPAQIYLRGSLCGAELSASAVDLEDNAGIEARSIAVTGMNLNFSVFEGGTGNTFAAENCALGPLLSFCSLSPPVPVGQNQPFPVYALEDYFPIHPLLGALGVMETGKVRARHGVYAPSGLRWPHVRGQRNGSSYRYSCRVPRVVRDVVDFCPGANEDSYYRHPFYPTVIDATRHWFMGRGTWDQNPGHSGLQSFAFDIGAEGFDPSDPHRIRAARAGRVSLLKEWSNTNDFACYEAGGTTGSPCDDGNYLYVRHQDGTFATYWHLTQNGVVPVLGDLVLRSSEIALAGNTGYSSAPHLHFHVQRLNGVDTSWSFRVRFQTAISTCSTWPNGDMSPSNNDPSVFY